MGNHRGNGLLTESVDEGNELGDLIKPIIREIHLFDSFVAGTTHLEDKSVLENVKVEDLLSMQREDNKSTVTRYLSLTQIKRSWGTCRKRIMLSLPG